MNLRYFPFYTPTPPPPPVFVDAMMSFNASSSMAAFTGFVEDAIANMNSMSTFNARPRTAKRASMAFSTQSSMMVASQVNRPAPVVSEDCAFVFPFNRWNWPGSVVSVNDGVLVGNYLASNTQLQQRSKVVRMASGGGGTHVVSQLYGDLSASYRINSMCIVSHNMTKNSTFRLRLYADAAFTQQRYDSGTLPIWEPSFTDSGPYEEEVDSDGTPSADLIEMLRYCGENPRTVRWIVFDEVVARYATIDFNDPNNPDEFTEIAYIYLGLCIRTHPDQVYGWSISPVSYARVRRSASGSLWTDMFYRQVVASATFASQPSDVTLAFWSLISQLLGKKKEFIVSFQPGDSLGKKFWYTIYGRFRQTPQLEQIGTNSFNVGMEIEELPG